MVGEDEGAGVDEEVGEETGEASGESSKLGEAEEVGVGDGVRPGNLIMPVDLSRIKPIAPTIIAATRPDKVDFMSYILSR